MEIQTTKTAEVKVIGELNKETKHVFLVCHGYGQLVKYFSKWLSPIQQENCCFVCPEALNKFYLNGFGGRVGANWMTKDKREFDIKDNHLYLNKVYNSILKESPDSKIHLIGFSQGAQTITRWAIQEKIEYNTLCLWGGRQAEDIPFEIYSKISVKKPFYIQMGDKDEYYNEQKVENWLNSWRINKIAFKFEWYKGQHKIELEALENYLKKIIN